MPLSESEIVPVDQWVIFPGAAEGFQALLGRDVPPALAENLRAHGLDPSKPLLPAYPAPQFEAWIKLAAEALFPREPPDRAQRHLGRRFFDGWKGTFIGAAATALLRVVGPKRTISRIGRVFRHGNNFTVTHATFESETSALVDFAQTQEIPEFVAGILEAGFELMGVSPTVTIVSRGVREFVVRIAWSAQPPSK